MAIHKVKIIQTFKATREITISVRAPDRKSAFRAGMAAGNQATFNKPMGGARASSPMAIAAE